MDKIHMQQIFAHYIEKFEMINNKEHKKFYKWQICQEFPKLMDMALDASEDKFANALLKVQKCTENIIDSYTQPFYGLVQMAKEEPEEVRKMFLDLYQPDNGDLHIRMKKIENFFIKSNELCERHYHGSHLYRQNSHSVSSYLFLYDPENHYMYKATQIDILSCN